MPEIELSDFEIKIRDLKATLDGTTREIYDTEMSRNSINYAIMLMESHRMQQDIKIKKLNKEYEEKMKEMENVRR
jgi:hypothetical protein